MATRVTRRAGSASLHWHGSRHGQPSVIADIMQKMKDLISAAFVATLILGSLAGCKPHAGPSKATGQSMGFLGLAEGANTEALIQALKINHFERIEGKNFQQVLPIDTPYRGYEGLVVLRDTTAKAPNEVLVGVGPDTVMWSSSHKITGDDGIAEWKAHVQKRIATVEQLSASLSRSEEENKK